MLAACCFPEEDSPDPGVRGWSVWWEPEAFCGTRCGPVKLLLRGSRSRTAEMERLKQTCSFARIISQQRKVEELERLVKARDNIDCVKGSVERSHTGLCSE